MSISCHPFYLSQAGKCVSESLAQLDCSPTLLVCQAYHHDLQIANLSLGANLTHQWYHHKFEDYPKQRRALFPFLY